jgi:hypothetical protein
MSRYRYVLYARLAMHRHWLWIAVVSESRSTSAWSEAPPAP